MDRKPIWMTRTLAWILTALMRSIPQALLVMWLQIPLNPAIHFKYQTYSPAMILFAKKMKAPRFLFLKLMQYDTPRVTVKMRRHARIQVVLRYAGLIDKRKLVEGSFSCSIICCETRQMSSSSSSLIACSTAGMRLQSIVFSLLR